MKTPKTKRRVWWECRGCGFRAAERWTERCPNPLCNGFYNLSLVAYPREQQVRPDPVSDCLAPFAQFLARTQDTKGIAAAFAAEIVGRLTSLTRSV